jgi:hypothetical protein
MTARNIIARLGGLISIGAGCGTSLWLRVIMPGAPQEPTLLQFTLVIASFVLTLGGILFVLNGDTLLARRGGAQHPPSRHPRVGPVSQDRDSENFGEDRHILGRLLARRAGRGIE